MSGLAVGCDLRRALRHPTSPIRRNFKFLFAHGFSIDQYIEFAFIGLEYRAWRFFLRVSGPGKRQDGERSRQQHCGDSVSIAHENSPKTEEVNLLPENDTKRF